MSNTQDNYERGLEDVLAALKALFVEVNETAEREIDRDDYDRYRAAKAAGRSTGTLDAFILVNGLLVDYRAKQAGVGVA